MKRFSAGPSAAPHTEVSPSIWLLRAGAVMLAMIIFLIDWLSSLDVAIAVLYVTVILMCADVFSRKSVMAVSIGCGVLTLAAFLLSHGAEWMVPPFARCLVSLCAIAITAFLAMKHMASRDALQAQIHLLHRSEAFLAGAQRLSLTGSIGLKMPSARMYWSDEARRIFQFDESLQPTLEYMMSRTHPDDIDDLKSLIEQAYARHANMEAEFRLLMPDGSCKSVRMLAQQVEDGSGGCEYIGALMDVTATKEAEEALHRSQSQLAHVTRVTTLGEMAASIAHEVNQPLSAVTTNAEAGLRWLNREVPNLDEVRSAIERIKSEAHRASEVIRRIRTLSRKTDPQHVLLDLHDVLHEAADLVRREVSRHRVSLVLQAADEPVWVRGDRVQLQQVIINLLINAVQAMSGMHGRARTLSVSLGNSEDGDATLCLRDNGPGISAQNLPNLFNPFFTTKPEGMGMGLSICRSIIDAHGGRIWAESELGHGASLNFSLPLCEPVAS
ncbi:MULTISPECIES: ATP-binding protein [unclassified Pseudomonas]|uniref:PAS domain-containing sensor histidine kinase n=1 Tax=unclassified Pseudomonas TaxID=196821 RepID=UPI002114B9E3|nr:MULTISPECIES: ATP-binding protein [unclassified Pseudomonas]